MINLSRTHAPLASRTLTWEQRNKIYPQFEAVGKGDPSLGAALVRAAPSSASREEEEENVVIVVIDRSWAARCSAVGQNTGAKIGKKAEIKVTDLLEHKH